MQFSFQLGGAVSLCISQTIFLGKLSSGIRHKLPEIKVHDVIAAGADNLSVLTQSSEELCLLRLAYQDAIQDVFIFLLVAACISLLASFGFEHKNVKKVEVERRRTQGSGAQPVAVM
jgi:hypothetical protein